MYLLFFIMWIIFNGRVTTEIIVLGLFIAAAVYGFVWKYMGYDPKKEWQVIKKSGYLMMYFYYLIKEIIKANMATIQLMLSANFVAEPAIIRFHTDVKSDMAKFLLANSITLTPGTITVDIEGSDFIVHCLDKSYAEGIDSSVFVKLLEKIEG